MYRIRYRIRTGAGKPRWLLDQGRAVYGLDGTPLAVEGIVTDITDEVPEDPGERFINPAPLRSSG